MRVFLVLLLIPLASAQVLFEDPAGDVQVGADLLRGELLDRGTVQDIVISLGREALPGQAIGMRWMVTDWFGRDHDYGLDITMDTAAAGTAQIGPVGADGRVAGEQYEVARTGNDPVQLTVRDVPFNQALVGIHLRGVTASAPGPTGGDTATGDFDRRNDVPVLWVDHLSKPLGDPLPAQTTSAVRGDGVPGAVSLSRLWVVDDGALRWVGQFEELDVDAFGFCGLWKGSVYAQDARPDVAPGTDTYWNNLVTVRWVVDVTQVAAPQPLEVDIDPRANTTVPAVRVEVDPDGWVQVSLEDGWWTAGVGPEDMRFRMDITCDGEGYWEAFQRFDGADDHAPPYFVPMPGLLAVAALLIARRFA